MIEIEVLGNKDTRSGFGEGLLEVGKINKEVVALCADLTGSLKMDAFLKEFPERFFQIGIAEANMIGMAAGMTIGGKIPYTGTFANFSTGRVYDQIRQSVAYSKKNVKICASHAGLTLGEDGATHQILEDNAREISEKKDRIFRIASFIISRFPKDGAITCLICEYRKSSNTYHTSRECPVLSDRCKRCLSLDHLENCTYRITFNDEAHILCGLPFENLDKFVYHLGTECFTNARDRLVPYLMYMYYMEQQMIEKIVDKEFTSASSFFEWLFQMEFSVTHAMELLYELDKNLLQNI